MIISLSRREKATQPSKAKGIASLVVLVLILSTAHSANAQFTLGDFEDPNDTDGWVPAIAPDFPDSTYLEHAQVFGSGGETSGTGAMRVEFNANNGTQIGGSGWGVRLDTGFDPNTTPSPLYQAFNKVAASESDWFLEFDATILAGEWSNYIAAPSFGINIAVNSDNSTDPEGGFHQFGNIFGNIAGAPADPTITYKGRIPMSQLTLSENSPFFQLNIGSFGQFAHNGGPTEGVDVYFDNIRFVPAPPTIETTLFSWETPDDGNTPGIDERFEGWSDAGLNQPMGMDPGDSEAHVHSIATVGNTHGNFALQIDREGEPGQPFPPGPTFFWGSIFRLDSDTNPDPNVQVIDPVIQARIDDLVAKINTASAFAFDVRFDEGEELYTPTFTGWEIAVQAGENGFFQGASQFLDGIPPVGSTTTIVIQTSSMFDQSTQALGSLDQAGLLSGSAFQIALATNTDGGSVYQIDNFRLITELATADFDADLDVDGDDFLIWQRNAGKFSGNAIHSDGDTNGDGFVDGTDLATWESQYGTVNTQVAALSSPPIQGQALATQVPEPTAAMLLAVGIVAAGLRRKRWA